jgi:hypothetical protein
LKSHFNELLGWYMDPNGPRSPNVSESRDVFEARSQAIFPALIDNGYSESNAGLIYSVVGEIGNNCFDHNLGYWTNQPGCYFEFCIDEAGLSFALADRGRGIHASLKNTLPELKNDQDAIDVAFERVVSGRFPEQRGNGLKYVRKVINGNPGRALFARSGAGTFKCGGLNNYFSLISTLTSSSTYPFGTLTLCRWSKS